MTRDLTNSMRSKWNSCHRAFRFCYEDLVRPLKTSDALSFGTAMHSLLEVYWKSGFDAVECSLAMEGLKPTAEDPYTAMTLRALFEGYIAKYQGSDLEDFTVIGAEIGFTAPLMNPETGAASKTFHLSGKIDAMAKDRNGRVVIVEHKTTSSDIGPGSDYWLRLPIDGQVSGYYVGAKVNGYDAENCVYDVIRKPTMKPYKATPVEECKYKKDGTLYASQHECDEPAEEWYARLSQDIAENPGKYFQRMEVARSETDLEDYLFDMWALSQELIAAEKSGRFSRNPNSCSSYGNCEYFDVCTGCASLSDQALFVKIDTACPELK